MNGRLLKASTDPPPRLRAEALRGLSILTRFQGDYLRARLCAEEALAISRRIPDVSGIARALSDLGSVAVADRDIQRAATLHDESIALAREIGGIDLAISVINRADLALIQGDYERTLALSEEGLELCRELGSLEGTAVSLSNWASAALCQGRYADALPRFLESLALFERLDYDLKIAYCLEGVAAVIGAGGNPASATRLLAAAVGMRQRQETASQEPAELDQSLRTVARVRVELGEEAFEAEWARGQAMTRTEAVHRAHELCPLPNLVNGPANDARSR